MEAEHYDVIVVGGGIVGAAVAERLTRSDLTVALIEAKATLGQGATAAAIGGITPQSDEFCLGPLGHVAELSRIMYKPWLKDLAANSDISIDTLDTGQIQVALQPEELARLDDVVAPAWKSHGFDIVKITRDELRTREPLLSDQVLGGYLLKAEFALEPAVLMRALQHVIDQRSQATIRYSCALAALDVQAAECRAVLTDETVLSARYIVLAVGRSATDFMQMPEGILFPVKGQAIELVAPGVTTYPLTYHCYAKVHDDAGVRSSYLVPRSDGRLVVGVTYEIGEGDSIPTRAAYDRIMRGLADLVPAAISWPQNRHWAGVRPGIVDGIPIISSDPVHGNLIYCLGHYGLGITLAPVSAEMVAVLVGEASGATGINEALRICSLERFPSDLK